MHVHISAQQALVIWLVILAGGYLLRVAQVKLAESDNEAAQAFGAALAFIY